MLTFSHEITEEMSKKMSKDPLFDKEVLAQIVKDVIDEVIGIRQYEDHYADDMIKDDIKKYKAKIKRIAQFDYNQIGGEGNASRSEPGVSIVFEKRESLFSGILPLSRIAGR